MKYLLFICKPGMCERHLTPQSVLVHLDLRALGNNPGPRPRGPSSSYSYNLEGRLLRGGDWSWGVDMLIEEEYQKTVEKRSNLKL